MEFDQEFGAFIRMRLREQGISQSDAARQGGFSRQSLLNWMNGDVQRIELLNIVRLALVLDITPYYCLQYLCSQLNLPIRSDAQTLLLGDHTSFVEDVTVPDNATVIAGQTFEKQWRIQNSGSIPWIGRQLRCVDVSIEQAVSELQRGQLLPVDVCVPVPDTDVGQCTTVSVHFTAPDLPGTVRSNWVIVDKEGELCFPQHAGLWCQVRVIRI